MLPLYRFDYFVCDKFKLSGERLGVADWECKWMLEQIERIQGHILEIGTHTGGTAREIALAFPTRNLFCVDVCDPAYGIPVDQIGIRARGLPNVTLTIQDSKLYEIPSGTGVIFIDGDHTWEGVKADTEKAMHHFRTHSGIIIWHDYNQEFEVMPYLEWFAFKYHRNVLHVQNTSLAFLTI